MHGALLQVTTIDPTTKWWLVIAVGITIFYAVMRPSFKKKKGDPLGKSLGLRPGLSDQRAVERDMNNLLVELSEMARQLTAQLDTRSMKLELLLKDADEKIAALKEAMRQSPPNYGNGSGSQPLHTSPSAPPAPSAPIDPRHLQAYQLADDGLSSQQIASRLSRPRGEIDLILALRERS